MPPRRHLLQGQCAFTCSENTCIGCAGRKTVLDASGNPTAFDEVTIDASTCKNGADLSWMCCRSWSGASGTGACTLKQNGCFAVGTPQYFYDSTKCNTVQKATCEAERGGAGCELQAAAQSAQRGSRLQQSEQDKGPILHGTMLCCSEHCSALALPLIPAAMLSAPLSLLTDIVAADAAMMTVQVHDGRAGGTQCSGAHAGRHDVPRYGRGAST